MNIYDALRCDGVRVSTGGRWLVMEDAENDGCRVWTVYERKPGARRTTILISTLEESRAVEVFLADDCASEGGDDA